METRCHSCEWDATCHRDIKGPEGAFTFSGCDEYTRKGSFPESHYVYCGRPKASTDCGRCSCTLPACRKETDKEALWTHRRNC